MPYKEAVEAQNTVESRAGTMLCSRTEQYRKYNTVVR
jgi:hypothetical protein